MKKLKFGIVGSIASLILVGGLSASIVQASAPETKIYACVTGINGNIIRVKMTPHTCPARTTPIEWSVSGAQGIQGVRGEVGPRGEMGIQGPAGIEGKQGIAGPQGIPGVKGDPGYSYGEALASVDDAGSSVQSFSFGIDGCIGPEFSTFSDRNERYCAKTFRDMSTLSILSVKTAPLNGQKPDARAMYIAAGECPSSFSAFYPLMNANSKKAFLMENASPFKLNNTSEVSCVFMYLNGGYSAQSGMYQVVFATS